MTSDSPSLPAVLRSTRLPALDGLRAVFVALVVLYHGGLPLSASLGVSGFFVLSGFLITLLLLREHDATGTVSLPRFYARRALRIFPAYYAFLALSIAADLYTGNRNIEPAILPGIFYVINYYNAINDHPSISIAHAWSLAVEEQFYLLWPALLLVVAGKGREAIIKVLLGLIAVVVAWRCIAWGLLGFGSAYIYNSFETRFDSLAIGCLLAAASASAWMQELARRLGAHWTLPVVTVALLIAVAVAEGNAFRYTLGFSVHALLLGILLLQALLLYRAPAWSWLEWAPVRYVGRISYGIYLYHIFGLAVGRKLAQGNATLALALGITATVLLASASWHVLESPLLSLRRRFRDSAPALRSARPS